MNNHTRVVITAGVQMQNSVPVAKQSAIAAKPVNWNNGANIRWNVSPSSTRSKGTLFVALTLLAAICAWICSGAAPQAADVSDAIYNHDVRDTTSGLSVNITECEGSRLEETDRQPDRQKERA